ncbi:MAG TPA: DUF6265 family protein, partial [Gemmatimonadales bacterium]|nr:DUF6265 family protein [Gemmatimonadales bacterium]
MLVLCALLCAVPSSHAQAPPAPPPAAADSGAALPAWLAGAWVTVRGSRTIEEQWNAPRGGVMLGTGRTTQGDRLVEFEFLRIVRRNGALVFIAQPNGAPPTEFALTAQGPDSVRFENPAHDFPQVVRYRLTGPGSLVAVVSAVSGGKERAIRFDYRRPGAEPDSTR